jgi:hypothetical protein
MTYLRIRLNKTPRTSQPTSTDSEPVIGEFVVKWNNGYWKLWNWERGAYQIGAFHTRAEALEVAQLGR